MSDNPNPYLKDAAEYIEKLESSEKADSEGVVYSGTFIAGDVPDERPKKKAKVVEPVAYVEVALHVALPKEGKVIAYNVGQNKEYRYIEAELFYANKSFTETEWRSFPAVIKKGAK